MVHRIFLSHSHKDNEWCDGFVSTLDKYDMDVWYDREGLYAGVQWIQTIEREIQSRELFILIITPESVNSEWVKEEVALALRKRKRIVSVIYKPADTDGFIGNYQMIDARGKSSSTAAEAVIEVLGTTKIAEKSNTEKKTTDGIILVSALFGGFIGLFAGIAIKSLYNGNDLWYYLGWLLGISIGAIGGGFYVRLINKVSEETVGGSIGLWYAITIGIFMASYISLPLKIDGNSWMAVALGILGVIVFVLIGLLGYRIGDLIEVALRRIR